MEARIEQYADYFEYWYDPATGAETLKVNGEERTVEEFNRLQDEDGLPETS